MAVSSGEGLVENNWIKGKVKWFNNDKGYGFISTDSNTDVGEYSFKTDYMRPLTSRVKLETGFKGALRGTDYSNVLERFSGTATLVHHQTATGCGFGFSIRPCSQSAPASHSVCSIARPFRVPFCARIEMKKRS